MDIFLKDASESVAISYFYSFLVWSDSAFRQGQSFSLLSLLFFQFCYPVQFFLSLSIPVLRYSTRALGRSKSKTESVSSSLNLSKSLWISLDLWISFKPFVIDYTNLSIHQHKKSVSTPFPLRFCVCLHSCWCNPEHRALSFALLSFFTSRTSFLHPAWLHFLPQLQTLAQPERVCSPPFLHTFMLLQRLHFSLLTRTWSHILIDTHKYRLMSLSLLFSSLYSLLVNSISSLVM